MGTILEPGFWIMDSFFRVPAKPCRPPTERAVGDDVVLALGHELEVEVCGFLVIVVNGVECDPFCWKVGDGPIGVVRE